MSNKIRAFLPEIGFPIYDLRRRKFGICIQSDADNEYMPRVLVHIEGDLNPRWITSNEKEYEYPKFYINDAVQWLRRGPSRERTFYVKHVHLHVPDNLWEYTISEQGISGFERYTIRGDYELELVNRAVRVL